MLSKRRRALPVPALQKNALPRLHVVLPEVQQGLLCLLLPGGEGDVQDTPPGWLLPAGFLQGLYQRPAPAPLPCLCHAQLLLSPVQRLQPAAGL